MLTINTIIKEMKDVPIDRLEDLYQFVHSLTPEPGKAEDKRMKILSFAGSFSTMSNNDYSDFLSQTKNVRTTLFDRNIEV